MNKSSLESLEEFITKLIFLQHIDFSENNISEISTELINRWRYLRTANLSKNQISTVPKGIRNMQHLGKLDLRKLFHPFFFKYFSQIWINSKVSINSPNLTKISKFFELLQSSSWIIIPFRLAPRISANWSLFGLLICRTMRLKSFLLSSLILSGTILIQNFYQFSSSLHILKATNNKITVFPENLQHLRLQEINLSDNEITELPAAIRNVSPPLELFLKILRWKRCEKWTCKTTRLNSFLIRLKKWQAWEF